MIFYAHSTDRKDKSDWQYLSKHLYEVAELTANHASAFGSEKWGYAAGLFHDIGKFSFKFQRRLEGSHIKVNHSTAGARELLNRYPRQPMAQLLAYIIAGHHSGLPDYGTVAGSRSCLVRRLEEKIEPYEAGLSEIAVPDLTGLPPLQPGRAKPFQFAFLTRMLFSCLVDADSLNTEEITNPDQSEQRKHTVEFQDLYERFHRYYKERYTTAQYEVDQHRSEIFKECLERARSPRGMFSLTLPTGSGKTMVSLGFALEHISWHSRQPDKISSLRRIVYVIPYTSIIEQNAKIFRETLGEETVLEHHSNVQHDAPTDEEGMSDEQEVRRIRNLRKLAEENWDMPLVVTTTVQFFESLFSNQRSQTRKLHNLANSVIVLDEAQMLYGLFFRPCLYALEELTLNYGCSVILCTATQPPSSEVLIKGTSSVKATIQEIVQDPCERYKQFERVRVKYNGISSVEELARGMLEKRQALCIVNTRNSARELHEELVRQSKLDDDSIGEEDIYHLSARMCPKHRMAIMEKVREHLGDKHPCLLVSTQLIEAGVDVDFPYVYRELAGLDSIAQAGGRCNRNKSVYRGEVIVFELERGLPPSMRLKGGLARALLIKCHEDGTDVLSLEIMEAYFQELNGIQNGLGADSADAKEILRMTSEGGSKLTFPFATISREFRMIEDIMQTVIIPYVTEDERKQETKEKPAPIHQILNRVRTDSKVGRSLLRQLQPYTVQLYEYEFKQFRLAEELEEIREGIWLLSRPKTWYSDRVGVKPYSVETMARELYMI